MQRDCLKISRRFPEKVIPIIHWPDPRIDPHKLIEVPNRSPLRLKPCAVSPEEISVTAIKSKLTAIESKLSSIESSLTDEVSASIRYRE